LVSLSARTHGAHARQGEKIIVTIERKALGGAFKVNGRNLPNNEVIKSDIDATNGVVHVRRP